MNQPFFPENNSNQGNLANSKTLSYQGVYSCPVCRYGEISALSLMDALACNFCRHIFTANLEKQTLQMADSSQNLTWYWNGKKWQMLPNSGLEFGWEIWVLAFCFIVFPPSVVAAAAYLFPPLPGTPLSWFPNFWTGLTFVTHLSCVLWLVVEYYQFPVFMFLRSWGNNLLNRR